MATGWFDILVPVLATILTWWLSTGLVFLAVRQPRNRHYQRFTGFTILMVIAFIVLWQFRDVETVMAAYLAFLCGIAIWAWHELSFLMGFLTGPAIDHFEEKKGFRHFIEASTTLIYHEIAIALTGLLLIVMLAGAANQVGLWTFIILWVMRLSAKLNIYLGVPNLAAELLPDHLRFVSRYFSKRPINFLFPISITVPTVVAGSIMGHLIVTAPEGFELVGQCVLGTLLALAVLEHWFLVLPVQDTALWRWALPADRPEEEQFRPSTVVERLSVSTSQGS